MTLKKQLYILLLIFCFIPNNIFSQSIKYFSEIPDIFIKEFTDFFEQIDNKEDKKQAKIFLETFTNEWNNGAFSKEQQKIIILTCNLMLKKKMKPFPHFYNYFNTLFLIKSKNKLTEYSDKFHQSLKSVINGSKSRDFLNFIQTCYILFEDNILYKSSTTIWRSDKANFSFEYDSVPYFAFKDITLICYANKDSAYISEANGFFYPLNFLFIGKGGKVNWKRAGYNEDSVYAILNKYKINLKYYKYSADTVKFYHKAYFEKAMSGKLEEKVLADVNEEKASYPRFDSYSKRIKIENIFKNISYEGGFSLYGGRMLGKGEKSKEALLFFNRKNKNLIILRSQQFSISKERIAADMASVSIYLDKDSIYHPGLRMKYIARSNELSFLRYEGGSTLSPYFNSFHKLDMYFEAMYWQTDRDTVNMEMIKGPGIASDATFESFNFFTEQRYFKIQGIDDSNPLAELREFSQKNKTKEFYTDEYARFLRKSIAQTKAMLLDIANMGFIIYQLDEEKIIIKERLFHYLDSRKGKVDYDVIQFNSVVADKKSNALLNLNNFDLVLRGVKRVSLSDSQKVFIYPKNQILTVKQNRDFIFNGRIHAGLFDFFGSNFLFRYDSFKIDLPKVDSLTFMVKSFEKDEQGRYKLVRVRNVIEQISGNLEIDNSKNKSGLRPFKDFPIFNSYTDSYVYFDKKYIFNGIYDRKKFYYKIYPFSLDSLDDFSTENLAYKGFLRSAGIFPDLEEPLKVQKDYSLGFIKTAPEKGYNVYGDKGTYFNLVKLSNQGLRGEGTLNYVTSITKSQDLMFFPDSMNTLAQSFEVVQQKEDVEFPMVKGTGAYIHWLPYKDLMNVESRTSPLLMYAEETKLSGKLFLKPDGLNGSGKMDFRDAQITADLFKYKNRVFDSDTADFSMKAYNLSEMAFITYNYKAHIDFDAKKGEFKSNGGGSKVEFPINMYICYMDRFDWYMDKDEIALSEGRKGVESQNKAITDQDADVELSGSRFISTHPDQDSLEFYSLNAIYNLRHNIIYAKGVKYINVADARIYPFDEEVTVLKKAEMKTLENSEILANVTTRYHRIFKASTNVLAKNSYNAKGFYNYIDDNNKKYVINFEKVATDSSKKTYGTGTIHKEDFFKLSDEFGFTGKTYLSASDEYLVFDGTAKIFIPCDTLNRSFRFKAPIKPKDIMIPVIQRPLDNYNKPIYNGILYSADTAALYSSFFRPLYNEKDSILLSADGYLIYDKESSEYRLASVDKLKTFSLPGNYISLNRNNCLLIAEGKIGFGSDFGRVNFDAYGYSKHFLIPDSMLYDLVVLFDFHFNDRCMDIIQQSIAAKADLKAADILTDKYSKTLGEILGTKEAAKLISELSLGIGAKRIPSELRKSFILTDLKLKWQPETRTFISSGPIAIGNMYREQINKYVDGYIALQKRKTGDQLYFYIELTPNDWFYFEYDCRKHLMSAISSNADFNKAITETKADNRKLKAKGSQDIYSYYISTDRRKNEFLRKIVNRE
ncbi:MAG: hypothetical protein KA792_05920 [Bacteroidales bacterium]|nr:hypothetical protein [Bacteroidales bacterium]